MISALCQLFFLSFESPKLNSLLFTIEIATEKIIKLHSILIHSFSPHFTMYIFFFLKRSKMNRNFLSFNLLTLIYSEISITAQFTQSFSYFFLFSNVTFYIKYLTTFYSLFQFIQTRNPQRDILTNSIPFYSFFYHFPFFLSCSVLFLDVDSVSFLSFSSDGRRSAAGWF